VENHGVEELQETAVGFSEGRGDVGEAEGGGGGVALGNVDDGIGEVLVDAMGGVHAGVLGHGKIGKGSIYS